MNWMVASILASLAAASAPLLMVESTPDVRKIASLASRRRRLWMATLLVIVALMAWLFADRSAVAAGQRSLGVAAAAVGAFTLVFAGFAYPVLQAVHAARATTPRPPQPWMPLFSARTDAPVLLLFAAAIVGVLLSPNDLGYRIKGGGMVAAALTLYFLDRPRAPWTFLAFVGAGAITLFAQWEDPWQRTIGVASQLAVAVLGFVRCARLLTRIDRAT